VKRRQFIALIGGAAAAWRRSSGLLNPLSAAAAAHIVGAFRRGMRSRLSGGRDGLVACANKHLADISKTRSCNLLQRGVIDA
jgi:hypothetical protein